MHLRRDSGKSPKQFSYQVQNSLLFYKEFSFHCSTIITFFFFPPPKGWLQVCVIAYNILIRFGLWKQPLWEELLQTRLFCGSSPRSFLGTVVTAVTITIKEQMENCSDGLSGDHILFVRGFILKVRLRGHEVLFQAICCLPRYQLFPGHLTT